MNNRSKPVIGQLAWVCTLFLVGCSKTEQPQAAESVPAIREFDVRTVERLGQEIYRRDAYAARATDILSEQVGGPEDLEQQKIRGWIVQEQTNKVIVRFLKQTEAGYAPAYDIAFSSPDKGILSHPTGTLSPGELAQFKARQLALKNIREFYSPQYNTIVLRDVDGEGYLVYALAATTDPDLVVIGGHYRVTVSPDGETVERVDRLFKEFLVLSKSDVPKDAEAAVLVASHVVSDTPVETHVCASLQHGQPIFIVTMDGEMWKIENGTISKMGNVANQAMDSGKK